MLIGVRLVDLVLFGCGDQHVGAELQQILVPDVVRAGEIDHRAGLFLVSHDRVDVQAVAAEDAALRVADGDHFLVLVVQDEGQVAAHVAEALDGVGRVMRYSAGARPLP